MSKKDKASRGAERSPLARADASPKKPELKDSPAFAALEAQAKGKGRSPAGKPAAPAVPQETQMEWVELETLIPYAMNSRTHSDAQVAQIAASIKMFGFTNPVLLWKENVIIAGHGRVMGARKCGMTKVPVIRLEYLSDEERRAYIIADNKLALNAGWDNEILAAELRNLPDALQGITGFSEKELAQLFKSKGEGLTDEDETPPPPSIPTTRMGDVWICGAHRVRCGDSTVESDVAALMGKIKPNLMVTDPPYGVEYDASWREGAKATGKVLNDDRADWSAAWALFPGNIAYVWHAFLHSATVAESLQKVGFKIRAEIIWRKARLVFGRGDYHAQHESAWYAVKSKGDWHGDRKQSTVWDIESTPKAEQTEHSTQKPVEAMRRPMENNSSQGQAVYDPFLGSGTSLIAAETIGRVCLGMELNPAYVDVAVARWEAFTGQDAVLESDGRTFKAACLEAGNLKWAHHGDKSDKSKG